MDLPATVRRTIRDHDLARPTTRVAVAVSGGSDSVALAHLMRLLDGAGELRAAGIVHFNHQLRAAADDDQALVARLAEQFGWPFIAEREDVGERARRERRSIEDAARTARHEFFERARLALDADVVAVGHTRDDQAETLLLRLLRGAGQRGLAGMHPRNGTIIRPLLDCRRADLRAYLDLHRVPYATDETNDDVSIPRNRVRAELIPLLESRFNPRIVDALADHAEIARDEWAWMSSEARLKAQASMLEGQVSPSDLSVAALRQLPLALRRLAVWRAMTAASGGRPIGFDHVRAALRLLEQDSDGAIDAPGQRVNRIGSAFVLTNRPARGTAGGDETPRGFHYPLEVPGEVRLAEASCVVSAETQAGDALPPSSAGDGTIAIVRSDVCPGPLAIRSRRPGDRFRPLGLHGRKKLQDYFVDRKVARHQRDVVPIVVDARDRIVWVAGHTIDDQFRVTDPAQAVLILRLKPVGGPA